MEQADKKQRIIQAAIEVFCATGFDGASMQQIAQAAGVAKGTTYLYFSSKNQLIDEVFAYCNVRNVLACDEGLKDEKTAIAKLRRRMENAIRWRVAHPLEARIEEMYMHAPGRGGGNRYVQQLRHFASVDAIIKEGIAAGELKQAESSLLGEAFFGIGGAFYFYFRDHPDKLEDADAWKLCMQMVTNCLLR